MPAGRLGSMAIRFKPDPITCSAAKSMCIGSAGLLDQPVHLSPSAAYRRRFSAVSPRDGPARPRKRRQGDGRHPHIDGDAVEGRAAYRKGLFIEKLDGLAILSIRRFRTGCDVDAVRFENGAFLGGETVVSMITSRQIRAARALLGWSQQQLADKAIVSLNAVARLENGIVDSRLDHVSAMQFDLPLQRALVPAERTLGGLVTMSERSQPP
jgi:Helix-turn-helix